MPSVEPSRPRPDCFIPPKGAAGSAGTPSLGTPVPCEFYETSVTYDGTEISQGENLARGVSARFEPRPGKIVPITIRYRSRGLDTWSYRFGVEIAADLERIRRIDRVLGARACVDIERAIALIDNDVATRGTSF